jgi:hypothetical protein
MSLSTEDRQTADIAKTDSKIDTENWTATA